jgi:acetyl esterase/lipase
MSKQDADMKAVTDELASLNGKPIESLDAVEARKQPTPADAVKALLLKQGKSAAPELVEQISERVAQLSSGALPIRIYTPRTGKALYPIILYFHGGGFVIASNDGYGASARALANGAEAVVLAVEYRKAPENKFPAAHDDAIASYEWALRNAFSFGGNPRKVALVGESAGGNLALNVSIAARDRHEQLPVWEVLVYPIAGSDMNTTSYVDDANAKPLSKAMMTWFTDKYFRTPADAKDKRIDLVNADLSGLPPTTIINAEIDPLRSEGELLAARMRDAKVDVQQKTYAGVTHEFFGMGAVVGKAKEAMDYAISKLRSAFAN